MEHNLSPEVAAQNKGPGITATICTVISISTIFVALRVYVRQKMLGKMHLDDYLIIVSMVFGWASVAFSIIAVRSGNGQHFQTLTTEQKSGAILWTIVGFGPGIMSFAIPKLAAVAFLTRIMNPSKMHQRWLWCMTIACVSALAMCIWMLFAQCTPARSQWDFSITEKHCWNPWILIHYAMFTGAFSAFVDLYLAIYPAIVLYQLQMSPQKKFALSFALGLGSIASVVAIYKTTRIPSLASDDFSYETSDLVVWTIVEGSTIIVATSIPVLRPLVERIFGKNIFGGLSKYRYRYKNYGSEQSGDPKANLELGKMGTESQDHIVAVNRGKYNANNEVLADAIIRTDSVTVSYGQGKISPSHYP